MEFQMIKWIKKDGREIETNDTDASIEAAINAGWVLAEDTQKEEKDKKSK